MVRVARTASVYADKVILDRNGTLESLMLRASRVRHRHGTPRPPPLPTAENPIVDRMHS